MACTRFEGALITMGWILTSFALVAVGEVQPVQSPEPRPQPLHAGRQPPAPPRPPVYIPPDRGAPGQRVSGGTRGPGQAAAVEVMAPAALGYVASAQPSLYWFISRPVARPMELTVADTQSPEVLLETVVAPRADAGFHRFRLADGKTILAPGVAYRWSVSIRTGDGGRSGDVVASGTIRHQALTPGLAASLAGATPEIRPGLYAESGYWYDAIDAISMLIAEHPEMPGYRLQRAGLLEQVGLAAAAAADRLAVRSGR